jgi:hypothetical protein
MAQVADTSQSNMKETWTIRTVDVFHNVHAGQVGEHALAEGGSNPSACTPSHTCVAHDGKHTHGVAIWTI